MDVAVIDSAFRESPLIAELEEVAKKGDFSVFESEAKRQHFVPRFLLSGFAEQGGDTELTYQLDVESGDTHRVNIEEAASRRYFYAILDEEGNRNNRIEGLLSRVEAHAAGALRNFLEDPLKSAPGDRATLSFFFALQDARTPVSTARMAGASNTIMRMLLAAELSNRAKFTAQHEKLFGPQDPEDVERFRQYMLEELAAGHVEFADPKARAISEGFSIAGQLAYVIFAMDWRLLLREEAFVASDRGLAMYDPALPYPFSAESWRSSPKAETTIPLSADACLLIRPLDPGIETQEVGAEGAKVLNRRTVAWADGYIFGKTDELVADIYAEASANADKIMKPRPRSQLLIFDRDPDDESFADANEARGWPRYLVDNGIEHDYVVVPYGQESLEIVAEMNRKIEERARRKLGLGPEEPLPGGAVIDVINPDDLGAA